MTAADEQFGALLGLLRESRGFDFSGYKRSSLERRVQRRMQQLSIEDYSGYVDHIQVHPDEYTTLFNTVLINVTDFFRDPESWDQLRREVLPSILTTKKPTESVRVWSAGCATGEEAYSIAALLAEEMGLDEFRTRVKIYATDVDEEALSGARLASYGEKEVRGVPPDLLERYFTHTGSTYSFSKDLRRSVIFGRNDLVQDAPISRVDLLVCRNTLMYLNAETQARVLSRFNFALNPSGVLFLGKAEMLLSHRRLFEPIDLKRRFLRKLPRTDASRGAGLADGRPSRPDERPDRERLQVEALLSSPIATVVVSAEGTVAGANQRAETMLGVSSRDVGRPFLDLDASYRPVELRPLLDEVRRERRPAWVREAEVARGVGERSYVDIQLVPLLGGDGLVAGTALYFTDVTRFRTLQDELAFANRQIETAYEELQSTVEELETTNEELQSTNEELETMNEELQSTNDELQSINDELRRSTERLDESNTFLESILRSLRSVVVVVGADLVVRVWNRQAEEVWGLRADEVTGEHLLTLDIGISTDRIKTLVRSVLAEGTTAELTMDGMNRRGRTIRMRILGSPLGSGDEGPGGVILVMDQEDTAPV